MDRKLRILFRSRLILLLPIIIAIVIIIKFFNSGDAEEVPETGYGIQNALAIHKDGSLTNTLTDNRVEDYQDKDAYEAYITGLVDDYNASSGGGVNIKSIKSGKEEIKVVIEYPDSGSFAGLNGYPFFYGTVGEALSAGYDGALSVREAKKPGAELGDAINLAGIEDPGDRHILITSVYAGEGLSVETFSKIKYIKDCVLLDSKCAMPYEGMESIIVW